RASCSASRVPRSPGRSGVTRSNRTLPRLRSPRRKTFPTKARRTARRHEGRRRRSSCLRVRFSSCLRVERFFSSARTARDHWSPLGQRVFVVSPPSSPPLARLELEYDHALALFLRTCPPSLPPLAPGGPRAEGDGDVRARRGPRSDRAQAP